MTHSRNTRRYTLRSVPSSPGRSFLYLEYTKQFGDNSRMLVFGGLAVRWMSWLWYLLDIMMMVFVGYDDDDGIRSVWCTVGVHSELSLTDGDHKPAMLYAKHKHMLLCSFLSQISWRLLMPCMHQPLGAIGWQVIVHNTLRWKQTRWGVSNPVIIVWWQVGCYKEW